MPCINYNDTAFRALFAPYANTTTYPANIIQGYWNSAILYISNRYGGRFTGKTVAQQTQMINGAFAVSGRANRWRQYPWDYNRSHDRQNKRNH